MDGLPVRLEPVWAKACGDASGQALVVPHPSAIFRRSLSSLLKKKVIHLPWFFPAAW